MNQVELEFILVVGLTIGAFITLLGGLVLMIPVSRFGKRSETYFQLGQVSLIIGILCIVGVILLYFFYPTYVLGLFKQAFRLG